MGGDKCGKWVSGQARTFSVSGKIEMFLSTGSCPVTYTAAHVQDSPPSPCVTITISLVVVLPKSLASCKLQLPNRVEIYSIGQFDFRLGPNLGRCGLRVVSYRGMCSSRRGTLPIRQIGAQLIRRRRQWRLLLLLLHRSPATLETGGRSHYLARKWPASRVFRSCLVDEKV